MTVLVVGGGVFGLTAALELHRRGHRVRVLDPGPLPHPLAASTDISKVIRMEYGPDETYTALAERARDGWLRWNDAWRAQGSEPLYHETGVLMIRRSPMQPGDFEHESWTLLRKRGHTPQRMNASTIVARFPAWARARYVDGFFHAKGGYAESGRVVGALARQAAREGVEMIAGRAMASLVEKRGRVSGVRVRGGAGIAADHVLVAAGAWTGKLVPDLAAAIRATGHAVFHLRPRHPDPFRAERFPVFTADIARTGFYGFPLTRDGVVKIGIHGPGIPVDPDGPRAVPEDAHDRLRAFLRETFPTLAAAVFAYSRLCLYADTQDEDFWIARDPGRVGLTVASGDSGHGFKFAPVLGPMIADVVEGRDHPLLAKFRWRPEVRMPHGREAARHHGES